ncbi:MAG: hypothetical protein PHH93_04780 [Prolixibacteraceae bacterium]|nr:hypothetical protein [Prolixibacteraceae bacterium]
MNNSKWNNTNYELTNPHRTWSLHVYDYSHSHKAFIVPWQINENKSEQEKSDENDMISK